MWHSQKDIINDLAILNDFGEPGNMESYKVLSSFGRGSKAKKKPQPNITVDPRTGEEIEIGDQCLSLEDMFYKGKGRGALLGSRSYTLLQKQLRLARPLGSSDEIIESYCRRNIIPSQTECSNDSHNLSKNSPDGSCSTKVVNSNETKSRIKAVRNSNKFNNALISGLLKNRDLSSLSLKTIQGSQKLYLGNGNCECTYKNGDAVRSPIIHGDSLSDDSNSLNASEDTASESLYFSSNCGTKDERLRKIMVTEKESFNTCSSDSDEDFNNAKFTKTPDEVVSSLKNENNNSNTGFCQNIDGEIERSETYRKLGEKLNKIRLSSGQEQSNKKSITLREPASGNEPLNFRKSLYFNSAANKFVYDELNFPPLVRNS